MAERGGVSKRAPYQQSPICTTSPGGGGGEEVEEAAKRFTASRFLHKVAQRFSVQIWRALGGKLMCNVGSGAIQRQWSARNMVLGIA